MFALGSEYIFDIECQNIFTHNALLQKTKITWKNNHAIVFSAFETGRAIRVFVAVAVARLQITAAFVSAVASSGRGTAPWQGKDDEHCAVQLLLQDLGRERFQITAREP